MRSELGDRVGPGRDRDRRRARRLPAVDVERRVSDHDDVAPAEVMAREGAGPRGRDRDQRPALLGVGTVGPELEMMPDAEVRELDRRSALEVPGQEAEEHLGIRCQALDERAHAREEARFGRGGERRREALEIAVEHAIDQAIDLVGRCAGAPEELAGDLAVGPSRHRVAIHRHGPPDRLGEGLGEDAGSDTGRREEGAVDIEEDEARWPGVRTGDRFHEGRKAITQRPGRSTGAAQAPRVM